MSQEAFAHAADVDRTYISQIERTGKNLRHGARQDRRGVEDEAQSAARPPEGWTPGRGRFSGAPRTVGKVIAEVVTSFPKAWTAPAMVD